MKLIGQILRQKRETLGMTLLDLEKKIKIQRKYIELIEQNQFDKLPNPDYAIGFLTKYAKAVNLNAELLIKEHEKEIPVRNLSAKEASAKLKTVTSKKADISARKLLLWMSGIILALFVVWLIASEFLFTDKDATWTSGDVNPSRDVKVTAEKKAPEQSSDNKQDTADDNKDKKDSKDETEKKPAVKNKTDITYKTFDGANLAYEIDTNESITLKLASKTPTWVQIFDNKKKNYAYKELSDGTFKIDKNAESLTIISGNSTELTVFVNGKKVSVPQDAEKLITRTYFFKINEAK